jgi:FtsP/CotA-like multicopper oxidase with cupredoxin domain
MPDPGDGSMTFFYTTQQSARLLFYHDHSYGITRLNVYAGEAAGYLIVDDVERELITAGLIPAEQFPLIIQDKTFVDADTVRVTDPTWNWGTGAPDAQGFLTPNTGDLVYSPAQNPYDIEGMNAFGRWHYGPWFWPPTDVTYMPVPNPYYDEVNAPWQPPFIPATPNPSIPGESFQDTPVVNGTAFPFMEVQPKTYRFRVLNAANDRFFNLQLYVADSTVTSSDGRTNTEVKMVPAAATAGFPETWPTDGRDGGVPDPATAGPSFIQIATEAGFLPAPAVIPNQPIAWNLDPTTFNFGNVSDHGLLVGPAERVDVLIDFSAFAGKTLILYNDAPAAFPARDARLDYYTGAPDLTETGGHPGPQVGFGPNTRTIMQIKVAAAAPAPAFDLASLEAAFATTAGQPGAFARSQDPIVVGQAAYDSAYEKTFPATWPYWGYARIHDFSLPIQTISGARYTIPMQPKAIQDEMGEAFDPDYGRMSGNSASSSRTPTPRTRTLCSSTSSTRRPRTSPPSSSQASRCRVTARKSGRSRTTAWTRTPSTSTRSTCSS